jgi:hypothetical protein
LVYSNSTGAWRKSCSIEVEHIFLQYILVKLGEFLLVNLKRHYRRICALCHKVGEIEPLSQFHQRFTVAKAASRFTPILLAHSLERSLENV